MSSKIWVFVLIWFGFPLVSAPLFTVLLDLKFLRFRGCFVGLNLCKDTKWTSLPNESGRFTTSTIFHPWEDFLRNPHFPWWIFRSASFQEFVGFDSLGISSNTPKNHLNRVWEFLEAIQLRIFGKNFRDLSWSRKSSRPPEPTGQTGSSLSSRPPRWPPYMYA